MKKISIFSIVVILLVSASCGKIGKAKLADEKDTVSYLIGVSVAKSLKSSDFGKIKPEIVAQAFKDVFSGDSIKYTDMQIQTKIQSYFMKLEEKQRDKNLKESQEFMEKNKKNPGVVVLPSGLQYQVIKEGTGPKPDSTDMVSVNYTGKLMNGEEFDHSAPGQPAKFPAAGGMIKGWSEAVLKMNVGSKWKIFVPSELGFGERGAGGKIKPNMALIFEIELLSVEPKQAEKQPATTTPQPKKK
jgi:FKBP-type peptidyl-prolyl cis-trans isomerase FklB